jgi:hypothetical protein
MVDLLTIRDHVRQVDGVRARSAPPASFAIHCAPPPAVTPAAIQGPSLVQPELIYRVEPLGQLPRPPKRPQLPGGLGALHQRAGGRLLGPVLHRALLKRRGWGGCVEGLECEGDEGGQLLLLPDTPSTSFQSGSAKGVRTRMVSSSLHTASKVGAAPAAVVATGAPPLLLSPPLAAAARWLGRRLLFGAPPLLQGSHVTRSEGRSGAGWSAAPAALRRHIGTAARLVAICIAAAAALVGLHWYHHFPHAGGSRDLLPGSAVKGGIDLDEAALLCSGSRRSI